jgi:hypothetical protein
MSLRLLDGNISSREIRNVVPIVMTLAELTHGALHEEALLWATGTTCIRLYYGMKPIDLGADKSTIEVKTLAQIPKAIDTIIEAVDAGGLDEALKQEKDERGLILRGIKKT